MTKRSTETVLRAELETRRADYGRAVEKLAAAGAKKLAADQAYVDAEAAVREARAATTRAVAAIEAYTGAKLEDAIDAVKERAATTGTHDPGDFSDFSDFSADQDQGGIPVSEPAKVSPKRKSDG